MQDERNLESSYEAHFVSCKDYEKRKSVSQKISLALSLVHSREAVRKIAGLIDKVQPDLMHCHSVYHQITPSIISVAPVTSDAAATNPSDQVPADPR